MAVSIQWDTQVITVNKVDMTLIQSTPTVVYQLNANDLRLDLKILEHEVDGMTFPDTHNNSPEITLSGITYARVFEITNGYTVCFEDDTYTVSVIGANNNIGDVICANNVSVIINNSAGSSVPFTAEEIATAVWDSQTNIHVVSGSFGLLVSTIQKIVKFVKTLTLSG